LDAVPLTRKDSADVLLFPVSEVGALAIYVTPEGVFRVNTGGYTGADLVSPDALQQLVTEHGAEIPNWNLSWNMVVVNDQSTHDGFKFNLPCTVNGETICTTHGEITRYDIDSEDKTMADQYKQRFFDDTLTEDPSRNVLNRIRQRAKDYQGNLTTRVKWIKDSIASRQSKAEPAQT